MGSSHDDELGPTLVPDEDDRSSRERKQSDPVDGLEPTLMPTGPGTTKDGATRVPSGAPPAPDSAPDATLVPNEGADATLLPDLGGEATLVSPGGVAPPIPASRPGVPSPGESPGAEGRVFANRFEVMSVLGEGGMGRVYRVRDRQIEGREVALKVLRPRYSKNQQFRTLFFQEIRAAQNFVSEHVVQVRDTGQMDDGKLFLTMDMVEGESLREVLDREGSLGVRHALEITRQVLLALQSGHDQGFVHRDVKPPNVMLAGRTPKTEDNPYGVAVRVLDFGIAGLAAEVGEGDVAGTPWYMSPEQTQGQRLDGRSDLFAVGVLFYEMVTGTRPFQGDTLQEVTTSVLEDDVSPLISDIDDLSAPLQKLLRKALQKDRDKRFQSAADFVAAIEKSKAYRMPTGMPRWVAALATVAVLAVLAEGYFLWETWDELQQSRDEVAGAEGRLANALLAQKTDFDEVERGLNARIADFAGQIQAYKDAETEEQIGGVETRSDEEDLNTVRGLLEKARKDIERLDKARLEAEKQAADTERRLEELKKRNETLTILERDEAKIAAGFDRIISFLEDDLGPSARSTFEELEKEGLLAKAATSGRDFLRHLTRSAASLYEYRRGGEAGTIDTSLLKDARTSLEAAEAASRTFVAEAKAAAWLEFTVNADDEPTNREDQAHAAAARLREQITAEFANLEAQHADVARAFEEGPVDQDPAAVIAHAANYGCDHLDALLSRFAAHLQSRAESGGTLHVDQLVSMPALEAWADHLRTLPEGERPSGTPAVLRYWAARHWYEDKDPASPATDEESLAAARLESATPRKDWKVEMALQGEIARADSSFPLEFGQRLIYRKTDLSSGLVTWHIDDFAEAPEDTGSWKMQRTIYVNDGTKRIPPQPFQISRRGMVYFQGSRPILDLQEYGPAVSTATWYAPDATALPSKSWFPSTLDYDEFKSDLVARPAPCLVVERGGVTRWFSPRYGLVREEQPGVYRSELVFAGPVD